MQITYRYTDSEYVRSRRLNKLDGVPKWKSLGIALLCLVPSLLLVTLTESFVVVVSFVVVAVSLILLVLSAIIRQPVQVDEHEHHVTFSDETLFEQTSDSQYELRWQYFDEVIENEDEFLLERLGRYVAFPKRIFTSQQQAEFRLIIEKINQEMPENSFPISLYTKSFSQVDSDRITRFTYQPEDLVVAVTDPLTLVDASQTETPAKKKISRLPMVSWFVIFMFAASWVMNALSGAGSLWSFTQYLLLGTTIVLPFILLVLAGKFFRYRAAQRLPEVPRHENELVLLREGISIGTVDNVSFYDWRDIDAFYQNGSCYCFKTFNNLFHVVPKRAFAGEIESEQFLRNAIEMHREFRRDCDITAIVVEETGNPYQPPAI